MTVRRNEASLARIAIAGFLSWIVPGLGHVYVGERKRGIVLLVVVALTFWFGVAIGGVRSTVEPKQRRAWFMAQVCAGSHALVALAWGSSWPEDSAEGIAGYKELDVAVIFTGVAGLLNILIILDALASCDPDYVRAERKRPQRGEEPS